MSSAATLLVTGAAGFVMTHVMKSWLYNHQNGRVLAVDLAPLDPVALAFFGDDRNRVAEIIGDVRDPDLWNRILPPDRITHLVHAAAVTSFTAARDETSVPGSPTDAANGVGVNVLGTVRAFDWAVRQSSLRHIVHVSTGSVYGSSGPTPLPEDGHVAPESLYGITKLAGEQIALLRAAERRLPICVVRLSSVFGPLDRATAVRSVPSVPRKLLRSALAGRDIALAGLAAVGDYIYAGDVGDAVTALLDCVNPDHSVYNVASARALSLRDLAELVSDAFPGFRWREATPSQADIALDEAQRFGQWSAYDIGRLTADCRWQPRSPEAALRDYAGWLSLHPY